MKGKTLDCRRLFLLKPFTFYVLPFTNDKDGLFEHPAGLFSWCATYYELSKLNRPKQFFCILYETGAAEVHPFVVKNTGFSWRNHLAFRVG